MYLYTILSTYIICKLMIYGMYFLKSHSIEYRELGYYNNYNSNNEKKLFDDKEYKILKRSFHKLKTNKTNTNKNSITNKTNNNTNKKAVVSVKSNNSVRKSRRLLNMRPEYDGL